MISAKPEPLLGSQVGLKRGALDRRRAFGGILIRKERWGLSGLGKGLLALIIVAMGFGSVHFAYPFLSITKKMNGEFLVVEGWIPASGLNQAIAEFRQGNYQKIITTGCIVNDEWNSGVKLTAAERGANKLRRLGMPGDLVQPVPCWEGQNDRTYHSALALKKWFQESNVHPKSIDVVSQGPHARRTRLLFEHAFGKDVRVGIIGARDTDYDPVHWWRSSEGVRDVIGEWIAYIYARFLFSPARETS
jgi:uncharacterized SAM-binding protein YcdF (DUF218 family)